MKARDFLKTQAFVGGGGGNAFIVNMLWDEETEKSYLDKTAAEITEAMQRGLVLIVDIVEDSAITWLMVNGWSFVNDYSFTIIYEDQSKTFIATAADAYPIEE